MENNESVEKPLRRFDKGQVKELVDPAKGGWRP